MPIILFHGTNDRVIDVNNSIMLKELLKPTDFTYILDGKDHWQVMKSEEYCSFLKNDL